MFLVSPAPHMGSSYLVCPNGQYMGHIMRWKPPNLEIRFFLKKILDP